MVTGHFARSRGPCDPRCPAIASCWRKPMSHIGKRHAGRQPLKRHGVSSICNRGQGPCSTVVGLCRRRHGNLSAAMCFAPTGTEAISTALFGRRPAVRIPLSRRRATANLAPKEWALAGRVDLFLRRAWEAAARLRVSYAFLPSAFTLYKVEDVAISNLAMQGYQLDGIYLHNVKGPCQADQHLCTHNGRSGVAVVSNSEVNLQKLCVRRQRRLPIACRQLSECKPDALPSDRRYWPGLGSERPLKTLIDGRLQS